MNVLIFTVVLDGREVKVDDMHDITNVKTTSRDTGSDHDGCFASAEGTTVVVSSASEAKRVNLQSILALTLSTIGVDRGGGQTVVEQEVIDEVRRLLALDEDQGTGRRH